MEAKGSQKTHSPHTLLLLSNIFLLFSLVSLAPFPHAKTHKRNCVKEEELQNLQDNHFGREREREGKMKREFGWW